MLSYWGLVLRTGWTACVARIRGGLREVIAFIIQTAILFAILYFVPWLGEVKSEARLAAATVGAVVLAGVLTLIWEIIRSPDKLHLEAQTRLTEAHAFIGLAADSHSGKLQLLELCREGRALLRAGDYTEGVFTDWKDRALALLRQHYDLNHVYEMEQESFHRSAPGLLHQRFEGVVGYLEQTALSWGSIAERNKERFRPTHV